MLMFSYLMATGITTGAFYALVALGIVIVYKSTEVVNLAHGELFMVGGMLAYTLYVMSGVPYLPSLLLAVAGSFVVGILTERVAYRSVLKHGLASVLVATIGVSFILKGIARYIWGGKGDYLSFPPVVSPEPLQVGNIMIMSQQLVVLSAAVVVMIGLAIFFRRTRAGKWMQATASNPKAALLCGLNRSHLYVHIRGRGCRRRRRRCAYGTADAALSRCRLRAVHQGAGCSGFGRDHKCAGRGGGRLATRAD